MYGSNVNMVILMNMSSIPLVYGIMLLGLVNIVTLKRNNETNYLL